MITVIANTILQERVYTFPEAVDFGTLKLSDIHRNPKLLQALAQTLMIYQFGGTHFTVALRTDVAQLQTQSERGSQGDRYQTTLTLMYDRLKVGAIRGSLFIETNDAQFRSLTVPIFGIIVP